VKQKQSLKPHAARTRARALAFNIDVLEAQVVDLQLRVKALEANHAVQTPSPPAQHPIPFGDAI